MSASKRLVWPVGAAIILTVLAAAAAWACTTTSDIQVSPQSGPAGSAVKIQGGVGSGPVEIRWNSASGPVLNKDPIQGPDFTVTVDIPAGMPPDGYVLLAVQNGSITARAAFEVIEAGYRTSADSSDASLGEAQEELGTGDGRSKVQTGSGGSSVGAGSGSGTNQQGPASIGGQALTTGREGQAPPAGEVAVGSQAASFTGASQASQQIGSQSVLSQHSPTLGSVPRFEAAPGLERQASRTFGDLWAGFDKPSRSGLTAIDPASQSRGSGAALALAAGIVTTGLASLFGGFIVSDLVRRRRLALNPQAGGSPVRGG